MPWIAQCKEDYQNILKKDDMYIVKRYKHNNKIILISTIMQEYITSATPEQCRMIFHPPKWVNK